MTCDREQEEDIQDSTIDLARQAVLRLQVFIQSFGNHTLQFSVYNLLG